MADYSIASGPVTAGSGTSGDFGSVSGDSFSGLFEPDVILPSQYLSPDEKGLSGGERKLMAAILSDGIEAYIAHCTAPINKASATHVPRRRVKVDAREWVDTVDPSYVFSFDSVCDCLGINPEYLRIGLARYIESINTQRNSGTAGAKTVWKKIRRPRKQ